MAESARWGDVRREPPDVPDGTWLEEKDWIISTFFPNRPEIVLQQFRARGLYPAIDAPELFVNGEPQFGGRVDPGDLLSITSTTGTIYYTLDGSDPRTSGNISTTTIVAMDVAKTALVPTVANGGATLGTLWTGGDEAAFAAAGGDASWASGSLGVGYDTGTAFLPYLGINVQAQMYGPSGNNSVFVRVPFTIDAATIASTDALTLKMKFDDGFVVYLNGQEVARASFAGNPQWNSYADAGYESQGFESFDVTGFKHLLHEGANILAIHGLNRGTGSSDMIVLPILEATTTSDSGGGVYTGPISLEHGVTVKSRVLSGDVWSALIETRFYTVAAADASNLAITEINYHPHDPTPEELARDPGFDDNDFEFIELLNTSDDYIDLAGVALTTGVTFAFDAGESTLLGPGEYLVLVRNLAAFAVRYGDAARVAGEYGGSLNNAGEQIVLVDAGERTIRDFTFGDSGDWPNRADGGASSLEVVDAAGDYLDPGNWRSSAEWGGSPGAAPRSPDVIVNEVLAHSHSPLVDAIELVNTTDQPIDVGGWFLSDSNADYRKFRIPSGTTIPAHGYLVFDESDFNRYGGEEPTDFALSGSHGEDVWLLEADEEGTLLRFADHVAFDASAANVSFGRYPDAEGELYPMAYPTLGGPNGGPYVGSVFFSEVHYNPGDVPNAESLEFVEIHNAADQDVDLSGWRLRKGIDFDFPAGTVLAAHATLVVVAFDPQDSADPANLAARTAFYAHFQTVGHVVHGRAF